MNKQELQRALQILDQLLEEYNIPNKISEDGVARINGMPVDEYMNKIGILEDK